MSHEITDAIRRWDDQQAAYITHREQRFDIMLDVVAHLCATSDELGDGGAGLTVVDPLIAVLIGMVVLGEAAAAPPWVLVIFGVAGAIAVWGVVGLARYHPQVLSDSQELGITRGSDGSAKDSDA